MYQFRSPRRNSSHRTAPNCSLRVWSRRKAKRRRRGGLARLCVCMKGSRSYRNGGDSCISRGPSIPQYYNNKVAGPIIPTTGRPWPIVWGAGQSGAGYCDFRLAACQQTRNRSGRPHGTLRASFREARTLTRGRRLGHTGSQYCCSCCLACSCSGSPNGGSLVHCSRSPRGALF